MSTCENCGTEFNPSVPSRGGARKQRFCSHICCNKWWRSNYKKDGKPESKPKPVVKDLHGNSDIITGIKDLLGYDMLTPSGKVTHYRPGMPGFEELARQYA